MRWSVTVVAEGDRVLTREEIVELADAVAVHQGIASGIGTATYGAQLVIEAATERTRSRSAWRRWRSPPRQAGLPPGRSPGGGHRRGRRLGRRVIRLGSLAGYPFEGPGPSGVGRRRPVAGGLRHLLPLRARGPARPTRGDLRRPQRRPVHRGLPVPPPAGPVLDRAGGEPLEGVHLHLRGAGRPALPPRADRPRADRRLPARAATPSATTRPGRTNGSASTPPPPPAP